MSLRVRFRFDGRCSLHPRYDPSRDGQPRNGDCEGCDSLYVIHLYVRIAKRRADSQTLIVARPVRQPESLGTDADETQDSSGADQQGV